jgi:antitoxin VapB
MVARSLNIKDTRAHELAKEISEITGESLTAAVIVSLEERAARLRKPTYEEKLARLRQITSETAPLFKSGLTLKEIDDLMYDEDGLPR